MRGGQAHRPCSARELPAGYREKSPDGLGNSWLLAVTVPLGLLRASAALAPRPAWTPGWAQIGADALSWYKKKTTTITSSPGVIIIITITIATLITTTITSSPTIT